MTVPMFRTNLLPQLSECLNFVKVHAEIDCQNEMFRLHRKVANIASSQATRHYGHILYRITGRWEFEAS